MQCVLNLLKICFPRLFSFVCFSFKVITVDAFFFLFPGTRDLMGKCFSCSVLCTVTSVRVCSSVKLRWRLYAEKKTFVSFCLIQESFTQVFLRRLAFIYIILWPSAAITKQLPALFSASAFFNYLLREDFDCSFLGSSRNHADLLWKKRLGGPMQTYTCLCTINLLPQCVPVHQFIKKEIS